MCRWSVALTRFPLAPAASPLAVSYPSTSCGARPTPGWRAVPRYAWRYDTPVGLPRRAEHAGRAVGTAWPPVGGHITIAIAPVFFSKADEYLHVLLSSIPNGPDKNQAAIAPYVLSAS
jgi:hypothetical protein